MSDTVIQVDSLGKKFRRGVRPSYARFSELLVGYARDGARWAKDRTVGVFSRGKGKAAELGEHEFWALKDVSFEVKRGEVLGIVGRNGAGKSTLLKLLSRISRPTTGEIRLRGRVGSLLEVGTGFHPELTGRENIYLNGTILGMRKSEIDRRFDEIVTFAEIDQFLDTPVKHYSSGMYMRLAFAVAAHLESEILLVDEVLAVGDAGFQRKCLGKMGEVAGRGRTVLLVSHTMSAIRRLCGRALWIDQGRIRMGGPGADVTLKYLHALDSTDSPGTAREALQGLPHDPAFRLLDVRVRQAGSETLLVGNGEPLDIEIVYEVRWAMQKLRVYFDLCDGDEDILIRSFHDEHADGLLSVLPGVYRSRATVPARLLAPRNYLLVVRATVHNDRSLTGDGLRLNLVVRNTSPINRAYADDCVRSKLQPEIRWQTSEECRR